MRRLHAVPDEGKVVPIHTDTAEQLTRLLDGTHGFLSVAAKLADTESTRDLHFHIIQLIASVEDTADLIPRGPAAA